MFLFQSFGRLPLLKGCLQHSLWLVLALLWVLPAVVEAETRFSLLTASPGKAVWAHYGHTGIRYQDTDKKLDVVFNYGLFDFSAPNFIGRFVTGQTDYEVGATDFYNFMLEYQLENRAVTEQVLNLTQAEKDRLLNDLLVNIQPENKVYRYNFFYKNCATQPRDMIEAALDGQVRYTLAPDCPSLRAVVHQHTEAYPWVQYGIDFALGAKADDPADLRWQQFAPTILMASFASAVIKTDSTLAQSDSTLAQSDTAVIQGATPGLRPLVASTTELASVDPALEAAKPWTPSPLLVMWLVAGLTLLLVIIAWPLKKGTTNRTVHVANRTDHAANRTVHAANRTVHQSEQAVRSTNTSRTAVLNLWTGLVYGVAGVLGSLLYFLLFFSEHPTVDVNYLAIWLHPLHLLFALGLLFKPFRRKVAPYYLFANLPLQLFAFAGVLFLPQTIHPAAYPFLLTLMLIGLHAEFVVFKRHRHA